MAEKIVSPGVFANEIDASFLPSAIGEIGAAVVGPTVKGPALVPTVVSSYAEFQAKFGDSFKSGSNSFQYLTSVTAQNYLKHSGKLTVVRILDGDFNGSTANVHTGSGNYHTGSRVAALVDDALARSFTLNTIDDGENLNNRGGSGINAILNSGSVDNVRWEIATVNPSRGTFTLLIRRGDDTLKRKNVLETWNNLSLDPNSQNYIGKTIGNSYAQINNDDSNNPYVKYSGDYPNKSKYVYISNVSDTIDYIDENGNLRVNAASASLPGLGSGSFDGSFNGGQNGVAGFDGLGNVADETSGVETTTSYKFYDKIDGDGAVTGNSQGFALTSTTAQDGGSSYIEALNLLANGDEYDINMILLPGICDKLSGAHSGIISKAIDVCETRGDCFLIYDVVDYSVNNITTVTDKASGRDSNYAATYWPWVQISDQQTGALKWVPPSAVMAGIYAFNDKIAAPWFAPAGLNRGGLDTVIQAARKLTHGNRDDLYESNVNPLATFPGEGVVAWGQKTLQKKSSALDRINVRRLLIKVKKFLSASSRFLVFEQNTVKTRGAFLAIANPFLEDIRSKSGLNEFKVIMDASNNTPDVIDRNILYGQIFLQPTKTAEFIVLDFTIQPTGASFPE